MNAITVQGITAPTITPRFGELLDHATITEGLSWLRPEDLFESYNCMDTVVPTTLCPDTPSAKDFTAVGWNSGISFAVYGGVLCKAIGFDFVGEQGEMERVFLANESRGVERALMENRFIAGTDWAAPVDITPASGPLKPAYALAVLEGYAGVHYAGVPTIHASRHLGSRLLTEQAVVRDGDRLFSHLGSKVAAGAGYEYPNNGPTGAAPAAGELWMYATGEVTVARSELIFRQEMNRSTNEVVALVERAYIAAVDCFTAAIRVEVPA